MRATTADIALQELDDFGLRWVGVALKETDTAHDHSRCAVSALECTRIEKRLLHGMQEALFFQSFDRSNRFARASAGRNQTRTPGRSADQNRAGPALPFSAAVLAAGQAEFIAEDRQERCVRRIVDCMSLAIDFEFDGLRHCPPGLHHKACPVQRIRVKRDD